MVRNHSSAEEHANIYLSAGTENASVDLSALDRAMPHSQLQMKASSARDGSGRV